MSNWEDSILRIRDEHVQWRIDFTKYLKTTTKYNGYRFFWELIPMIYFITGKKGIAWTDDDCNIYLNIPHKSVEMENTKWEFIYYHECLHQLFETFEVEKALKEEEGKGFSHYILNVASDCIINNYIKKNCGLDYPTDGLITPEYLLKAYNIEYKPREDNQYDLYKKIYAIRDQLKSDALIQRALENMPDVDLDIEGGGGPMPKTKKVPSTDEWKLGSKEARHLANNILAKYSNAAPKLPNGKLSKEDAINAMRQAADEIRDTLLGKPVNPNTPAKEGFSYHVMSSSEFIFEAEASVNEDEYSTFEQGWDYAINDVLNQIENTIQTFNEAGGANGGDGGGGENTDPAEVQLVPENDPTEERPFLPQANQKGEGGLSEPNEDEQDESDSDGDGSSGDGESGGKQGDKNSKDKNNESGDKGESDEDSEGGELDSNREINKMDGNDAANSAKKSADAAQKAANDAKQEAEEAQAAADNASDDEGESESGSMSKRDLENAARKAKQAADKAQEAADKAQEAADKAEEAARNGDDEEAKNQAKNANDAARDARKYSQRAAENNHNNESESGKSEKSGEEKDISNAKSGDPEMAESTGKVVDWDPNSRDNIESGDTSKKGWGHYVSEIKTFVTKNKFGDMKGSDVKTIVKRLTGSLDPMLGDFVQKCKDSRELKTSGIVVKTTMQQKNPSWSRQFSNIIKNTVKQRVNKKLNEWRKTFNRPNRRQGVMRDGDMLKKGKVREKDRLTISIAYYVDVSYSMDQSAINNIFKYIYEMNNGLKRQYRGNAVVEDCMFKIISFSDDYKEITPPHIPEKEGGTESLLSIVRKMKSLSQTYMINVILTDGAMNFDFSGVKAELEDFAGNIVFITNDQNMAPKLQPLTSMSGGQGGKKFELIIVDSNFNINADDFNSVN